MTQTPDTNKLEIDKLEIDSLEIDCHLQLDEKHWHFQYHFDALPVQGIVGHSGCGKTTLLRVIAGLEKHATGRVSFQGQDWQNAQGLWTPAHQRPTVMAFQDVRLLGHISVEKNLLFAVNNQKIVDRYWQTLVDILDIKPLLNRRPSALSGGEKQRVGFARSLLADVKLWLFDEPLSAVDNKHKAEILTFLNQHLTERDAQSLYVTHQHQELEILQAPSVELGAHIVSPLSLQLP